MMGGGNLLLERAADIKTDHMSPLPARLWKPVTHSGLRLRIQEEEELYPPKIKPQDTVTSPPVNKVPNLFWVFVCSTDVYNAAKRAKGEIWLHCQRSGVKNATGINRRSNLHIVY